MNPTQAIGDILRAELIPSPQAEPPQDADQPDALTRQIIEDARRRDAWACYERECPIEYRDFDSTHPALAAYLEQVNTVLAWRPGKRGLLLSGSTGRGKTRAVWALIRRLALDGVTVRSYHASDWFSTLQARLAGGRDDARGWIDAVARHPVVFVDDLGQEAIVRGREAWAESWFLRFVDLRVSSGRPLLVTTNLTASDFGGSVRSDPLLRRLLEVAEPVRFGHGGAQ
jgi:DNA replication protein DnaC